MNPDLVDLVIGNAPTVLALLWLVYRLETALQKCFDEHSKLLSLLVERLAADETTDSERSD